MNLHETLEQGDGFSLHLKFLPEELDRVRYLVRNHWLEQIRLAAPESWEYFNAIPMNHYHQYSDLLNHDALWCKANRILPESAVGLIRKTSLIKNLEQQLGAFNISNEEALQSEEIYWRLVRPNQPNDMGPLHADSWFWDLGHGTTPPDKKRIKVWIALECEPGLNGLRLVPHSQKKQWRYHGEYRHGFVKPVLDEEEHTLGAEIMYTSPGDAVVFHDNLLHGGAPNHGKYTRVSMEFTIFAEK